jgi:hypothetical protein
VFNSAVIFVSAEFLFLRSNPVVLSNLACSHRRAQGQVRGGHAP